MSRSARRSLAVLAVAVAAFALAWLALRRTTEETPTATPAAEVARPAQAAPPSLAARPRSADGDAAAASAPAPVDRSDETRFTPRPEGIGEPVDVPISTLSIVDAATGLPLGPDELRPAIPSVTTLSGGGGGSATVTIRIGAGRWVPEPGSLLVDRVGFERPQLPGVTTASAVLPMRRTVEVTVLAVDARGRSVAEAKLESATAAGGSKFELSAGAGGAMRVQGVPFFPGEPVWVRVAARIAAGDLSAKSRRLLRDDGWIESAAMGVLPATWQPRLEVTVPFDDEHTFGDEDLPTEESLGEGVAAVEGEATIRLRVVRVDGTPARAVAVRIAGRVATIGADGTVVASRKVTDGVTVSIIDPSLTPTTEFVPIRAGEVRDVLLREPEPASLDVAVTFADGRAAPFARLEFVTPSWVPPYDVVDGVLRLDPSTNVDGRRTFTRVEPAEVVVKATWGSRSASTTVRLLAGRRGVAHVVLPEPSMDPPRAFRATESR